MPEQETGNDKGSNSWIKRGMRILFHGHATPRILLFFIAILIKIVASALAAIGFVFSNSALMIAGTAVWLIWFAVLLLIAVPAADRFLRNQMRWLKPTALTIFIVFFTLGLGLLGVVTTIGLSSFQTDQPDGKMSQLLASFDRVFAYNDATALTHQAADNAIDGKNPYAESNIVTAMIEFNGSFDKLTPLREGRFAKVFPYPEMDQTDRLWQEAVEDPEHIPPEIESKFCYPAGCFLLPAPFILMGIGDLRIVYLILIIPTLAYVILRARRNSRIFLVGALLASLELWNSLAAGETGLLYFPFLLLAWILPRRHLWLSALFMGVAVAIKQVAWFLMPFYLILIFREMGLKRVLAVMSIIAGVFLAANAPFIISDPKLWIASMLVPMTDNLFPLGVGIISLVTGGLLEIQSPLMFTILEVGIAVAAIIWYFFYCPRYPHTGPILAVLPLFFAWRSLWGYFFYIDIIVLAAIIINEYGMKSAEQLNVALVPPRNEQATY
jgi:hypothetical protein